MRDCKRHPSQSQPGGGVCASCLKERLARLWRGEISPNPKQTTAVSQDQSDGVLLQLRDEVCPSTVGVGCLASVRKQRDPRAQDDGGDPKPTQHYSKDVMVEWAEFHARRRRRRRGELNSNSSSPKAQVMSRSLDSIELKPFVDGLMDPTNRCRVSHAQTVRSRSMPLDNRSAEETALRVIREQADHLYSDELDFLETADGTSLRSEAPEQLCNWFWQSGPKTVPKWVKLLVSPMTTSRNKVFPSKGDVRKGRKRLTRFDSADWSHADARWIPMSGAPPGGHQRRRSSSFPWLQDTERTKTKKYEPPGHRITLSSGSADLWVSDLTTVGHLHEIAEEQEIVEESSAEEDHNLGAISSFGKFLLRAAERQPKAGLTRLASAA